MTDDEALYEQFARWVRGRDDPPPFVLSLLAAHWVQDHASPLRPSDVFESSEESPT